MRTFSIALILGAALGAHAQAPQAIPPESAFMRTAHAARKTGEIKLDGKLDDPAWQAAPLEENFTQAGPDEGKPATVHTAFRLLWDDDALYFGAICDDPEPPTARLSRRDRFVESDSVQFDLDTTLDRRTAYHFQVFAAGQQLDGIHYNDTNMTTDWDAAWESAVARTPTGWSVEMRIPLRGLRIPENVREMGFNVYRILSRRHEEDQWRYRPNGRAGDVSRFGLLDGLAGMKPVRQLELRPFLAGSATHTSPAPSRFAALPDLAGGCYSFSLDPNVGMRGCGGLDLRFNLASDLTLVGTVNPDFGQVEADQRVLNLSTFETFFPEKRPFFLEGLDLFKPALRVDLGGPYGGTPYQIFYSRRIGRTPPTPDIGGDEKQLYLQPSVPVLTAAKVSGTIGSATVGLLSAVEPSVSAQVLDSSGHIHDQRATEPRNTAALRLRQQAGSNVLLGFTGTAVDPFMTEPAAGLDRRHAHVGSADVTVFNDDRSTDATLMASGSLITGRDPGTLRDGTAVAPTQSGAAISGRVAHEAEHWFLHGYADYLSPQFTVNDLGYMQRANLSRAMAMAGIRNPHPTAQFQRTQFILAAREVRNANMDLLLERDAIAELNFTTNSFWFLDAGVIGQAPYVDDRELADGTPLERRPALSAFAYLSTDSRRPLQVELSFTEARAFGGFERQNQLETVLTFKPLPQLEGSFDLAYNEVAGTIRQIREATALPGPGVDVTATLEPGQATRQQRLYLLAEQQARSISGTLRATYAFTPYLTLQAYAQLFTAGVTYGKPLRAVVQPGKETVKLDSLRDALPEDQAPNGDDRQAGLNVNLILRWEWRTGSTFYLVYAHQSANDLTPLRRGLSFADELAALSASGVTHGDTLLVKVDLLSAL